MKLQVEIQSHAEMLKDSNAFLLMQPQHGKTQDCNDTIYRKHHDTIPSNTGIYLFQSAQRTFSTLYHISGHE